MPRSKSATRQRNGNPEEVRNLFEPVLQQTAPFVETNNELPKAAYERRIPENIARVVRGLHYTGVMKDEKGYVRLVP